MTETDEVSEQVCTEDVAPEEMQKRVQAMFTAKK
jgi:hypothetical protein